MSEGNLDLTTGVLYRWSTGTVHLAAWHRARIGGPEAAACGMPLETGEAEWREVSIGQAIRHVSCGHCRRTRQFTRIREQTEWRD